KQMAEGGSLTEEALYHFCRRWLKEECDAHEITQIFEESGARRIHIPTYQFKKTKHWLIRNVSSEFPVLELERRHSDETKVGLIKRVLVDIIAQITELPRSFIVEDSGFDSFGFTSEMIVQFNDELSRRVSDDISKSLLFE